MKKIFLLFAISLFLNSCTKDRRSFHADVVFFYDEPTASELNAMNFDRLDYYIEEEPGTYVQIGSKYPTSLYDHQGNFIRSDFLYSEKEPICYQEDYITTPIEWYTYSSTVINYIVYGVHEVNSPLGWVEFETVVDEYSFDLYANECAAVPIIFISYRAESTY